MAEPHRSTSGRTVTVLVLMGLVLTICAGLYLLFSRLGYQQPLAPISVGAEEEAAQMQEARQLTVLLTILLISALLILLFVLGAYLLIRVGRIVARTRVPVGGKPTDYVDAWQNYRLTDEQILAATTEDKPRQENDDDSVDPDAHWDTDSPTDDPNNPPSTS